MNIVDMITISDGTEIFVNSQVQEKDMAQIIQIATSLGYTITKNNPYSVHKKLSGLCALPMV